MVTRGPPAYIEVIAILIAYFDVQSWAQASSLIGLVHMDYRLERHAGLRLSATHLRS
jgi:hypothetical protein